MSRLFKVLLALAALAVTAGLPFRIPPPTSP